MVVLVGGSQMGLTIYGQGGSRALRALWLAEELGIEFEHVPTRFADEAKAPEYLKINPNGRVPSIDDDGFIVWESMAVNLYLAKKYGGDLAPKDLQEEATATQWSFWVMTEVEKTLLQALFHTMGMFGAEKDPAQAAACIEELWPAFAVLNAQLEGQEFLLGGRFTVADLNVASVLSFTRMVGEDLSRWPALHDWFTGCMAREALARAQQRP
jgi:glutathione S-transferase